MKFIDMDREIEKVTGLSVSELFRRHGEVRFRSEEKLMTQKLSKKSQVVIATGGGIVLQNENIETLRENGILICLEAETADIFERVSRKRTTRPLLKRNLTVQDIEKMISEREPFYACADFRVNTSGRELDLVVKDIIKHVRKQSK